MNPEKLIKYLIPLFTFAIISRAVEEISFIYYAVPVLCVFFILYYFKDGTSQKTKVKGQKHKPENDDPEFSIKYLISNYHLPSSIFHQPILAFVIPGIWFLITSLWSSFPIISAERAVYFILLSSGCISVGILWSRFNKKNIFGFLLPVNVLVVLLCLFSLMTNIPDDSWSGGNGKGFMGFFGHQNELASVLLFTMPVVFNKLWQLLKSDQLSVIRNKNSKTTTHFWRGSPLVSHYLLLTTYYLLLSFNLLLLTLTYSRASILSLVIGAIIFLILNKNWKVITYSIVAVVLIAILILLIPPVKNFSDNIIKKDFPEYYSSRLWMWEPSYRAALDGGLIGLGYGISDPKIKPGSPGDHYEGERFIREKGNSFLALIEEVGLIGLILFILPIVYILTELIFKNEKLKIVKNNYSLLILYSTLAALLLHAQFEAWWVGVGSVQLPLFFIYFGLIVQSSRFNSLKIKNEDRKI